MISADFCIQHRRLELASGWELANEEIGRKWGKKKKKRTQHYLVSYCTRKTEAFLHPSCSVRPPFSSTCEFLSVDREDGPVSHPGFRPHVVSESFSSQLSPQESPDRDLTKAVDFYRKEL